ncbi:MAG: hypothetical protein HKP27_10445 [Myxococcales bacterium]|nr:hypothetical protein [Myxococcales bacterium]
MSLRLAADPLSFEPDEPVLTDRGGERDGSDPPRGAHSRSWAATHSLSRPHRVSVRLKAGIDVDLRVVAPESYGSALLYFTGRRAHVVALRRLALAQGLRLNEYGPFRGRERIAGETERGVYEALSLPYLPPEERESESALRDALRKLAAR